jgi:hypothetical protein
VPPVLAGMERAFPSVECLPKQGDADGSQWVADAGNARADLQIGVLEALRDYQFLAPSAETTPKWAGVKSRLTALCGTPSIENLSAARQLIRELAQGVDLNQITTALRKCEASIEMSPQAVQANEKARLSLRFKNPDLNKTAALESVICEWSFGSQSNPQHSSTPSTWRSWFSRSPTPVEQTRSVANPLPQNERGWEIFHYFVDTVTAYDVTVRFYVDGELVSKTDAAPDPPLEYKKTVPLPKRARDPRGWSVKRLELIFPEFLQLFASLLVPLATLAVTQANQGTSGSWWELLGVGFGSETVRAILTGKPDQTTAPAQPPRQSA